MRPPRCDAGMPPLLTVKNLGVDQPHLLGMRLFVKNVSRMTIPWIERASVLPRDPCEVFYKTATAQAHVRYRLVWRPQWSHDDARCTGAGAAGDAVVMRAGLA
jgi:hypothetical protein